MTPPIPGQSSQENHLHSTKLVQPSPIQTHPSAQTLTQMNNHFDDTTDPIDTDQHRSVTALPLELIYRLACLTQFLKPNCWIPWPNIEWSCPHTYNWSQLLATSAFQSLKNVPTTRTPQHQGTEPFHCLHLDLMRNPFCFGLTTSTTNYSAIPVHCHNSWQTYRLDWSPNWKHSIYYYCSETKANLYRTSWPHAIRLIHLHWCWNRFTSTKFISECPSLGIKVEAAAPEHQEMNGICKAKCVKSTTLPALSSTMQDLEVPPSIIHMLMQFKSSMSALLKMLLIKMETQQKPINSDSNASPALPTSASLDVQHSSKHYKPTFRQQDYHLQATTPMCFSLHLPQFSWKLRRLAHLLFRSTPKPHRHPRCQLRWRLQFSSLFRFRTLCWSHPHPLPLQSKWTSQHSRELWTIHLHQGTQISALYFFIY